MENNEQMGRDNKPDERGRQSGWPVRTTNPDWREFASRGA